MKKLIILMLIFNSLNIHSQNKKLKWFKGNTHVHTTLSGHADTHPDTVALWYLDRNWNFLILSEHNHFIDPKSINLPKNRRKDFILIPGEEVSDYYEIHTTGMNITREVFPHTITKENRFEDYKTFLMQKHTDSIRSANGIPILNHPNWRSGASSAQIEKVKGLHMIELYNGHPDVNNWGNKKHASMEQKWDSLLTAGKRFYGVSSDDAHFFKKWAVDESNPGRGWVMVRSKELTPDAITEAMANGDFYSSNGVILKKVDKNKKTYKVEIDVEASLIELQSDLLVGKITDLEKAGFSIQFIGDGGKILHESNKNSVKFKIPKGLKYVRSKIIFSRVSGLKSEQFYAWTQPIFLNNN